MAAQQQIHAEEADERNEHPVDDIGAVRTEQGVQEHEGIELGRQDAPGQTIDTLNREIIAREEGAALEQGFVPDEVRIEIIVNRQGGVGPIIEVGRQVDQERADTQGQDPALAGKQAARQAHVTYPESH